MPFYTSSAFPSGHYRAVALALTEQNDRLIECRLTFQVNLELYKHIGSEDLFNLKPEIRCSLSAGDFQSEFNIQLEVTLKPDLLPRLAKYSSSPDEAAAYLLNLSQQHPDDPLLHTESWLALSVKQFQEESEIGYSTFWSYVTPAALAEAVTSGSNEAISAAITNFFKDWTEANLAVMAQKNTAQTLDEILNFLNEVVDASLDTFACAIATDGEIFQAMVNFFKEDDWQFHSA